MRLILTRHGETIENIRRICQGQKIQGTLSEKGISQAKKVALRLKNEKIDAIYSSDLKRSSDTAKEIAKYHPNAKFELVIELREKDHGDNAGKNIDDMIKYDSWDEKGCELEKHLILRAKTFLDKIFAKHQDSTVVFVGHGMLNLALISVIMKNYDLNITKEIAKQDNTCINVFDITEDGNHNIMLLNCTKHLE